MLLGPCIKFSEAGAGLGLWDLKSLRFKQVDGNPIAWQSLSLELQPWPSSVSAAEAPGAAALSQLCSGKGKLQLCGSCLPCLEHLSIPKTTKTTMARLENAKGPHCLGQKLKGWRGLCAQEQEELPWPC